MKCQYCGTNTKQRYCENCGAFMGVTDETNSAQNGSSIHFETYETQHLTNKPIFKKWWFWLIVVVVVSGMIKSANRNDAPVKEAENNANSSSTTSSVAPAPTPTPTPAPTPTPTPTPTPEKKDTFGIGEAAEFKTLKVTANKIDESEGVRYSQAPEGKIFVGVQFTVENISNQEKYVGSLFDAYLGDMKIEDTFDARIAFSEGSLSGKLAAGKKLQGWYAVEVPSDWSEIEIHVTDSLIKGKKAIFVVKK